ncbi:putative nuclease HARBI1 [Schistocerca nitens]|uniref:putative nuclease HARBI1 n=1 Tax=Schistocerca nitens TaxID=7011 RepID=UPI002118E418|nr:putative nuclease HARBI1 [Schistocerca nitens]
MNSLLITLRAYATGAFNILIGDNSSVNHTTAQRIISDVSDIIASMSPRFIKFPTREVVRSLMYDFSQLDRFTGVLGTLDCTHIRIQSPGGHKAELFRNRKSYFSFNCQTISDHNLLIRDIVARWPGLCARQAQFENGEIPQGHLLGDSGYACRSYLLTPLINQQNEAEHRYNRSHIKIRNTVERKYGLWKRRFPILSMQSSTVTAVDAAAGVVLCATRSSSGASMLGYVTAAQCCFAECRLRSPDAREMSAAADASQPQDV